MAARRQGEERVWERERGADFAKAHRELVDWRRAQTLIGFEAAISISDCYGELFGTRNPEDVS